MQPRKADRTDVTIMNRWYREAMTDLKAGNVNAAVSTLLHLARFATTNADLDAKLTVDTSATLLALAKKWEAK